ncbi:MAG: ABC transporter permease subunit [Lentisphaerota bacterium]
MPIVSQIGRRSPGVRALYLAMYVLLFLGAATMIYPFLLMLAGSTRSAVDMKNLEVIPRFLFDDTALYQKHVEGLFNESMDLLNSTYDSDLPSFDHAQPPVHVNASLVSTWQIFLRETPLSGYAKGCGYLYAPVSRTTPRALRDFRNTLARQHGSSMEEVNQALGTDFASWNSFFVLPANYLLRQSRPSESSFSSAFFAFAASQPDWMTYHFSVEGFYKKLFLKTQYTRNITAYNQAHGTAYRSYDDLHLTETLPEGTGQERSDWEIFVRNTLNLLWIRADRQAEPQYRRYLKAKYITIESFNRNYGSRFLSFEEIPMTEAAPTEGIALSDWETFISGWKDPDTLEWHAIPAHLLHVYSVDLHFQQYLRNSFANLEALNTALNTSFGSFAEILPPQREAHYLGFLKHRREIRRHFMLRNYQTVLDDVLFHGRGIWNTVVYCSLSVLFALIINPLGAYAMSRYRMPATYKILLFLMLTMAFPPMVTQIPMFLMLRDLNLLNTFAALLLPGLANGYSIFLLKGFFDSLPRELYENAQLDGAGEWTMFWQITMRLSMPILAVLALTAFTAAYTNFMFALLICQDEKMWTMMVWLYELQQRSGQAVLYASLILAAIPTFILFFFCQKIIIRGLVVPMEK